MYFLPNQYFHCWQKKYKLSGFARCFCDLHSKLKVLVQMDYIFENAYQCRISFKNSGGLYFQASFAPTSASFGKKKQGPERKYTFLAFARWAVGACLSIHFFCHSLNSVYTIPERGCPYFWGQYFLSHQPRRLLRCSFVCSMVIVGNFTDLNW